MNHNHFETNLAALRSTRPHLADWIEQIHPDPARYALLQTQTSFPSLEVTDSTGKHIPWHSRYDPMREAEREISALDHSQIYVPLFCGVGLGYTPRLLWEHHRNEFFNSLILEKDPAIFRLAMEVTRLDDIFSDPRAYIYIGDDLRGWPEVIRGAMAGIMSSPIQPLPHAASQQHHNEHYRNAIQMLSGQVQAARAEFDLMIRSGQRIQENLWLNLPAITQSMPYLPYKGLLKGLPTVVAAAGPSLDQNVHQLKESQDRVAIIAVDTAFRTLKEQGIDPHFLVSTDPTELNLKHFENITPSPDTALVFDPEVYYQIPRRWPHKRILLNLEKAEFTRWIETAVGPFGFLPKGGSVGHTAYYFARELGADPIIFVGLDLAFDPKGGATHTQSSALKREHGKFQEETRQAILGPRYQSEAMRENIVWVPGVKYDKVPTSQVMSIYIQQFEEQFTVSDVRIIDATEGGARIKGTTILPLSEALRCYAPSAQKIRNIFQTVAPSPRDINRLQQDLGQIIRVLEASPAVAREGLDLTQRLSSRLTLGAALRDTPEWQEMESCFADLYHSQELKIALEQALFGAVYQFIQKERHDQVGVRLEKYKAYFHEFLKVQPSFRKLLASLKG